MSNVFDKELEIRNKLIELLKPQIENEEVFCEEFVLYNSVHEYPEIEDLIESEKKQYTEEGTLRLAEIFYALTGVPKSWLYSSEGTHFNWKLHRLVCLCLYERAAQNGSAKAYYKAGDMYCTGLGVIANAEKGKEYLQKAKSMGYTEKVVEIKRIMPRDEKSPKNHFGIYLKSNYLITTLCLAVVCNNLLIIVDS